MPYIFCSIIPSNKEKLKYINITREKKNCKASLLPKISIFNFRGRGLRERGNGEGEGGRVIIRGRPLFQIFRSKGSIIRVRRLIEGRLLFEEIRYTRY